MTSKAFLLLSCLLFSLVYAIEEKNQTKSMLIMLHEMERNYSNMKVLAVTLQNAQCKNRYLPEFINFMDNKLNKILRLQSSLKDPNLKSNITLHPLITGLYEETFTTQQSEPHKASIYLTHLLFPNIGKKQ